MLRAAVQENADSIAGRLPSPLRPWRRRVLLWARRAWMVALPAGLAVGAALVAIAAPPVPAVSSPDEWADGPAAERLSAASADASVLSRPLRPGALALHVRRVVLDAGHGGDQVGASSASGLLEKDVTLDLAERTRRLLVEQGLEVALTRAGDETLSLRERAAAANQRRGDIFVSIHLNSFDGARVRGIETYYVGPGMQPEHEAVAAAENEHSGYSLADMRTLLEGIYADARRDESKRLAQSVQDAMVRHLRTIDPAITDRGVKTAPFVVLVATGMPAILAEVASLSNSEEAERLRTPAYRQTIAEALVQGIQSFIDHTRYPDRERKASNER